MAEFLEELLPVQVRLGASLDEDFAVEVVTAASGSEYRRLFHGLPRYRWRVKYTLLRSEIAARIQSLHRRVHGRYAGFRVACQDDRSTAADGVSAPTALDHPLTRLSAGVYQLVKRYGVGGTPISLGYPTRILYKPVAGSALVAVGGTPWATGWTLDTTTGQIAFSANLTKAITGISKAASAVITFGSAHPFTPGQTVHLSGVAGMTQINGQRAAIQSSTTNTITVAIDSTGYATYTSGGTANTQPQSTETVTGGCLFDLPARFDSPLQVSSLGGEVRDTGEIDLIELINP